MILALLFSGCASSPRFVRSPGVAAPRSASAGIVRPAPDLYLRETNPNLDRRAMLVSVMGRMGIPYDDGGMDSAGVDCSGFVLTVYREAAGIALPRSSQEQFGAGAPVDAGALQFGDLVFFNTTGRIPSHVGIYVGDGLFAHASVSGGVTVSLLNQEYYRERYVGARRIAR
jgi:hypothetical protein